MSYIDWTYFQGYSPNSEVTATEFPALAERASDVIDMLTFCRLKERGGLSAFPASIQEAVKKATAAQVETLHLFGGSWAAYARGSSSEFSGGTINGIPLSPLVQGYLSCTGLMYAGVVDRGCY